MRVLRSKAEPDLTHVLLTDAEVKALRSALKKNLNPFTTRFRKELKTALETSA